MEHMENATQRAAEVMSQGAMPCTSAVAMLPTSSQNIAETGARVLHHSGPQSSVILSAMLAILILATTVAFLLFQVLEKQAAARRQAGAGMQGLRSCDTLHERLLSTSTSQCSSQHAQYAQIRRTSPHHQMDMNQCWRLPV